MVAVLEVKIQRHYNYKWRDKMQIERRGSNFSQFTKDEWLRLHINGMSIDFDLDEKEIKEFCSMLISLSSEILFSSDLNSGDTEGYLDKSIELLNDLN